MKQYSIILVFIWVTFSSIGINNFVHANEIKSKFNGHALLRYENETRLSNQADRERMRLIARVGINTTWSARWTSVLRASTGLKNKQNVPAITIYKFTEQPQPDNDVFVERAFVQYASPQTQLRLGKQPWYLYNVTDTFWDRNLHPIGVSLKHQIAKGHKFNAGVLMPLDGQSGTIGQMYLAQYHFTKKTNNYTLNIAPWIAFFNGQGEAEFATRDTDIDHKSMRLSSSIKRGDWQLGVDTGLAIDSQRDDGENFSITTELRHGNLKQAGNWLTQFGYSHVERNAVIREFGQNARAAKLTTNFSGWDMRVRYKLNKSTWIGARFSHLDSLEGPKVTSNRFRIEARWSF
ncbi:MAG: putative porin [Pseudomonadota bacterium]